MVKMASMSPAVSTPSALPTRVTNVVRMHSVRAAALPRADSRQEVEQIQEPSSDWLSRRALLMVASAIVLPSGAAQAYQQSSLCVDTLTEDEDRECRRKELARDAVESGKQENYSVVTKQKFELAPNVPVAALDSEYAQATLRVSQEIESYCSMDVYDKDRIPLIKALKADGTTWVSKYARGGSARSQSARRMYIAVDSIVGHLASNGYAPLPKPKVKVVLKTVEEAKDFLARGI